MGLQQKYEALIQAAQSAAVKNLQVREQQNVLYINGEAPSEAVKKQLWDIYQKIDPDFRSADLIMDISVAATPLMQEYEVVSGDNLSKIGRHFGVSWKEIYEVNRDLIRDPDVIQPGWRLKIPTK